MNPIGGIVILLGILILVTLLNTTLGGLLMYAAMIAVGFLIGRATA